MACVLGNVTAYAEAASPLQEAPLSLPGGGQGGAGAGAGDVRSAAPEVTGTGRLRRLSVFVPAACSGTSRPVKVGCTGTVVLVLEEYALGGAVEVLILSALERPEKSGERGPAQQQRQRHQEGKTAHSARPHVGIALILRDFDAVIARDGRRPDLRRKALATTSTEDSDIARAATSGVT